MNNEMTLPDGLTCKSCSHFYRCSKIFGSKAGNKECDFFPVRFNLSQKKKEDE